MSVSLVKILPSTIVYVAGYGYGPYLPDPDALTVCASIETARLVLSDELERGAESADMADDSDSASMLASAELVRNDRDGDVTDSVKRYGGWSTSEPDGWIYYIDAATLGEVFGDDTSSEAYGDVAAELLGYV